MKYEVGMKRECDVTQLSIAAAELSSTLSLIRHHRQNEATFHELLAYAIELQGGLREMELELKRKLREHGK